MTESKWFQLGTIGTLSLSVVSSVSIVICNKALITTLGFNFVGELFGHVRKMQTWADLKIVKQLIDANLYALLGKKTVTDDEKPIKKKKEKPVKVEAVMRIQFPDNCTLEGTFYPSETIRSLNDLKRQSHTCKAFWCFTASCWPTISGRTYSEWVIDREYDWPRKFCICHAMIEEGTDPQTTRLGCLRMRSCCILSTSYMQFFSLHASWLNLYRITYFLLFVLYETIIVSWNILGLYAMLTLKLFSCLDGCK
ncbi:uncharacterized protein LOC114276176 isoform X2 [Camellia sinensis]|uniref:uncharacterized protein LOC114276176 isoform X2 n=1 Tax=Camellia sinensis TaxID=4442 RepID=UPI0010356ECA|nr:uncharacterized protein LOC114276176 isoform X2 [Camellia sinensis]